MLHHFVNLVSDSKSSISFNFTYPLAPCWIYIFLQFFYHPSSPHPPIIPSHHHHHPSTPTSVACSSICFLRMAPRSFRCSRSALAAACEAAATRAPRGSTKNVGNGHGWCHGCEKNLVCLYMACRSSEVPSMFQKCSNQTICYLCR